MTGALRRSVLFVILKKDVHPSGSMAAFHNPLCNFEFIVFQKRFEVKPVFAFSYAEVFAALRGAERKFDKMPHARRTLLFQASRDSMK